MRSVRSVAAAAAAAALLPVAAAGCGFGPGESSGGEAELRVTRDYGSEVLLEATEADLAESDTVMRVLDGEADLETRYGGGFVQSIDGLAGGVESGRSVDWFFFINGIESPTGAADVPVRAGDRIWWDYRDWSEAMRAPAVVGSFPEPFAQEAEDDRDPVQVECAPGEAACDEVSERLVDAGVEATDGELGEGDGEAMRLLVGPWEEVRSDATAALIEAGPGQSGVFADFSRTAGGWRLDALDAQGRPERRLDSAGLVAALHPGEDPPVWVVAGTDASGVELAAEALAPDALRDTYAVAATDEGTIPLPAGAVGGA